MTKILSIGECMIELRPHQGAEFTMSFSGDSYNVAVYLARLGQREVFYFTAVGEDPYSQRMKDNFQEEHLHTDFVKSRPSQLPGLYFIHTDQHGERHFYYYRAQSAARLMLADETVKTLTNIFTPWGWIYLSGITLAILPAADREKLIQAIAQVRNQGVRIVFDTNYRSRLWEDSLLAQQTVRTLLPHVDIALVTFEDERALFGDAAPEDTIDRLKTFGVTECVVKWGEKGAWVLAENKKFLVPSFAVKTIVDTTAAGDSFNAAYLHARIQGQSPLTAAEAGHRLASLVIQHPGAIISREISIKQ